MIALGDIWWADLADPAGSEPGFRRPVVVVQGNLKWAEAPGDVPLSARATGLPKPSVVNVSQLVTLDRSALTDRAGRLPRRAWSSFWPASTSCSAGADARVGVAR